MRLALVPAVLALGLAACGGSDAPPAQVAQVSPAGTPAQTASPQATASAAPTTAPTTAPTVEVPAAATPAAGATEAPEKTSTPDPASTPAPTATPLAKDAPTATPTPTPKPAKATGPVLCLSAADLKQAKKAGSGLWSGTLGGPKDLIAVDGPYPSPRDAQLSVESLAGISDAEVGGNYVVSASLSMKAKSTIHKVADCLDARDG